MSRILSLEVQIAQVKSLLRTMCDAVYAGLNTVVQHFENPQLDERLIKVVIFDSEIDNLERSIDSAILQIFATQQPLGYELRFAYACAKIVHHVERVGDAVESIARQLVNGGLPKHKNLLLEMLLSTRDIFIRSYTAMFDGDLSLIQEIYSFDDKIEAKRGELYNFSKSLLKNGGEENIAEALRIINMSSKVEKIANLACNWAQQIDFAENGMARKTIKKRRYKLVFIDDIGGLRASLVASFLYSNLKDNVDISVISTIPAKTGDIFKFASLLSEFGIVPQVFPIGNLSTMNWNNTLMFIQVGNFTIASEELTRISYKTTKLKWSEISFNIDDFELDYGLFQKFCNQVAIKTKQIEQIIHRKQEQI